jgi:hypothetical protein
VYIDKGPDARFTLDAAVMAFGLLRPSGMMVFDDYTTDVMHRPAVCPKMAIDFFTSVYAPYVKIVHTSWQVMLLKRSHPLKSDPSYCRSEFYHENLQSV